MERITRLFDELQALTAIPATSGFEQAIARRMLEAMRPLADRVEVDPFGNVCGTLEGAAGGPTILVPAHSDSVGMIVSHLEENGYLRFDTIGAVPPNLVYAQRVLVVTPQGPRVGVVGSKPGHVAFRDLATLGTTVPLVDSLFIDVGAASREEARSLGIAPGQQVTWDRELAWLGGPATGLVTGRSLDDKVGCLVLLEAMRSLRGGRLHATLVFVAAVQEEVGLRGAIQTGNRLRPDACIGIDATVSQAGFGSGIAAHPSMAFSEAANSLGQGPGLSVMDRGATVPNGLFGHPALLALCREAAERSGIPYQIEGSMPIITSDAAGVQLTGGGVPAMTVKIPSRYTHGPIEVCSLRDVAATADLLAAALASIGPETRLSFI
jgi:tetrahedral aminopeptidase